jgi:tetratricopeptide (TPR) repeat protein
MPHQSAIADLEIADLYAELNLGTEAIALYERVVAEFARLKMRAEQARACLNYGRAAYAAGDNKTAERQLKRSLKLFKLEKNNSGQATAILAHARLALESGRPAEAIVTLSRAAPMIRKSENPRDVPAANWLEGEANLRAGSFRKAEKKLALSAAGSQRLKLPDLEQASLNSLAKLARATGEAAESERHFKKAISLIERLRAPLAAEEFSMSFLASRLDPYDQLARLYLQNGRVAQAFRTIENGRSRSLLDSMDREGYTETAPDPRKAELAQVRAELNLYYKRLDRADVDEVDDIRKEVIEREARLSRLTRQIASINLDRTGANGSEKKADVLARLYAHLGKRKTLVEFVVFDGMISAFVVGRRKIGYFSDLAAVGQVSDLLDELHFQFGSLRYGAGTLDRFRDEMRERADRCLEGLYELLLGPIEHLFAGDSLIFVPAEVLHYVPFQALRDGENYLIERFEVSYAPSASIWARLQKEKEGKIRKPLLMAFADERIPLVEDEVRKIKEILPRSKCLTGKSAGFSTFARVAADHDLIHLACHGQFRPENPMFSSLHMSDGWITVHDICSQSLKAELVTLSACETGLSKVFAGDEILGLARGFLTAGASSLIVSLWTVNDKAAGELMTDLYTFLQRGTPIASSLRDAQLAFIERGEHPYLWSPFVLIGRG